MTRVGVPSLQLPINCGLILLLAALPIAVRSEGKLDLSCNATLSTCSTVNAKCVTDVCVCVEGFYPAFDNNATCTPLEKLNLTVEAFTTTTVSLRFDGPWTVSSGIEYKVNCTPVSTSHDSKVEYAASQNFTVFGLQAGHLYRIVVVAVINKSISISEEAGDYVLLQPKLPVGWDSVPVNTTTAQLTWNASSADAGTNLEIRPNGLAKIEVSVSVEEGKVDVTGLTPGNNVSLSIQAVISRNTSEGTTMKSSSESHNVWVLTLPDAPASLNFTDVSANSFKAVITASLGNVDHYLYTRSDPDSAQSETKKSNTTEEMFDDLTPYTLYTVSVIAVSNNLNSTEKSNNVTTHESLPSSPENLTFVVEDSGGLVVSWDTPVYPNGVLIKYELKWERKRINPLNETLNLGLNVSRRFNATEAPPGSEHCFKVRAYTAKGNGDWSDQKCVILRDSMASKPIVSIGVVGTNSINISVSHPDTPNGIILCYYVLTQTRDVYTGTANNGCVKRMILEVPGSSCNNSGIFEEGKKNLTTTLQTICGNSAPSWTKQAWSGDQSIDGLDVSTLYRTTVFAMNRAGPGKSQSVDFLTEQRSSMVDKISVTDVTHDSCKINLKPPAKPNGVVVEYLLKISDNKSLDNTTACYVSRCDNCTKRKDFRNLTEIGEEKLSALKYNCTTTNTSSFMENAEKVIVDVGGLRANVAYTVKTWPVNSLGPGNLEQKAIETNPHFPCPVTKVKVLNATTDRPDTLTVEWKGPVNENGEMKYYYVNFKYSTSYETTIRVNASERNVSSPLLKACSKYEVHLIAENEIGNSSMSNVVTGYTRSKVPEKPKAPMLHVVSSSSLRATWTNNKVDNCGVEYEVELNRSSPSFKRRNTTFNKSFLFEGLEPFSAYTAKVRARSGKDIFDSFSLWSDWSQLSPPHQTNESTPDAVQNLRCKKLKDKYKEFDCTWNEPKNTNGEIKDYQVKVYEGKILKKNQSGLSSTTFQHSLTAFKEAVTVTVAVSARTSAGYGPEKDFVIFLVPGPPGLQRKAEEIVDWMKNQNTAPEKSTNEIILTVPCFVFNSENGEVKKEVVIVCVKGHCGNMSNSMVTTGSGNDVKTWRETDGGRTGPYEVSFSANCPKSEGRRRKRSVELKPLSVLIGNCLATDPTCKNGPLHPDTEYQFGIRGYTANYSLTVGSIYVETDAKTNWALIVSLLLLALAIVAAVFLGFLLHKRRQRANRRRPPADVNGPSSRGSLVHLDDRDESVSMMTLPTSPADSATSLAYQAATGVETAVPIDWFPEFVQQMSRDCRLLYTDAFNEVKKRALKYEQDQGLRTEEAALQSNRLKNRFANILPFDHTRVCLSADDDPTSGMDYINANYISGHSRRREFIACQGPLSQTIDDFWRMIWEQNASLIVMLTLCVERGRNKCEQYWPQEDETRVYGDIAVRLHSQSIVTSYALRVLDLMCGSESRRVAHLQMLTWEDFSAPNPDDLTLLMEAFRANLPAPGSDGAEAATVVHCSAGVGRTGTFIALDRLMKTVNAGSEVVDINGVILSMRSQRRYMVQSEAQYIFIHDFMLHYLKQRQRVTAEKAQRPGNGVAVTPNGSTPQLDTAFANNGFRDDLP